MPNELASNFRARLSLIGWDSSRELIWASCFTWPAAHNANNSTAARQITSWTYIATNERSIWNVRKQWISITALSCITNAWKSCQYQHTNGRHIAFILFKQTRWLLVPLFVSQSLWGKVWWNSEWRASPMLQRFPFSSLSLSLFL